MAQKLVRCRTDGHPGTGLIFGPPFVKWFALCYQTAVCPVLSVTLVTDRTPLEWLSSTCDLDLGLGHTAYRSASIIELYLHVKSQGHVTETLEQIAKIRPSKFRHCAVV